MRAQKLSAVGENPLDISKMTNSSRYGSS